MKKELELWQFIHARLTSGETVMLLVVAESSGSSPGRAGYKMAIAADRGLSGSVGGGVMEVGLVEEANSILSDPGAIATGFREQVHQKNSTNASGMICSGRQTVILKLLTPEDKNTVDQALADLGQERRCRLKITPSEFQIGPANAGTPNFHFEKSGETQFLYEERLGEKAPLSIVGGGHCALALSELAVKLDFRISIFDDRPELNTIAKNEYADEVTIVRDYEAISKHLQGGADAYVVVMTLGYASDKVVIKQLIDRDFAYFGVLGSKAKMATLMKELKEEGLDENRLAHIRTPIGIPINSRTPEEIAVSIAAEIIAVKNAKK